MRKTIRRDQDVLKMLQSDMLRMSKSLDEAVNDAVRKSHSAAEAPKQKRKPFKVRPLAGKFRKDVDPTKLKRYLDDEDDAKFLRLLKPNSKR